MESKSCGVLDTPLARGMSAVGGAALQDLAPGAASWLTGGASEAKNTSGPATESLKFDAY
jgi:hypothetical protein